MKTLERRLGLTSVVAISIAAMLGSGLFVLPGVAVRMTGPGVWLAYLVAGLTVLPAALSKAELATAMPESGGTYIYVDRTFGPLAGTIMGLGLWLSLLLKSAFALFGFGAYLGVLTTVSLKPVSLGLLVVVVALNLLGVRKVGKVQTVVVVVVLVALAALIVRGSLTFSSQQPQPTLPHGIGGFLTAVSFVYISYAGVTKIAAIAEEVENPGRNLPLGILISLGVVTLLYSVVTFILVGNVPLSELRGNLHPIYTLADAISGYYGGLAAAILGVVTMTSMANSGLLAASRFPFAMSRNNLMPGWLHFLSTRFMTPMPAIALTGALMAVAIVLLDVERIAKLASCLMIVGYMVEHVAVLALRESSAQWYKPAFRSPLYPYVQVLGVVVSLALLTMLGALTVLALTSVAIMGLLLFFLYGRHKTERRGVMGILGPRRELLAAPEPQQHLVLPEKAAVVVPLLGRAHGAEALAEVGDALGGRARIEVVHIRDIPEQVALDLPIEEDPVVGSLSRRIRKLAHTRAHDIVFDAVATHDHIRTIHEISRRVHCEWLVMEWRGRTERGVLPFNPLGWLVDHLSCNLALFKDVGSRSVGSILAFAEPGPHDALVAMTADQMARYHDAELTFARFVPDSASETTRARENAYLDQMRELCTVETQSQVVGGKDAASAIAALSAQHDLLILGAPPEMRIWTQLRGSAADRLMRLAACSALRVKAPRRLVDRTHWHEPAADGGIRIDDFIEGECLEARLPAMSKQVLFNHIAARFARVVDDATAEGIEQALWTRERAQSTAAGHGLALPHASLAEARRTHVGLFTTAKAIDYKAPDGRPVDIFIVILGPPSERNIHLQLMRSIAWLVGETRLLERLRLADDPNELQALLLASSALQRQTPATPLPETPVERAHGEHGQQ
ncbi:MAG: amino acid permease [Myxococcales bacterium]|nr:amino acid permease [Myxococcales bacterium]